MTRSLGSRYVLEEIIGRGGFGQVWRGRDIEGRAFAFKVLHAHYGSDGDVVQRFVRERSILVGLRDPHLVRVWDLVVEGDTLALVMDLVEGGDLRSRLRSAPRLTRAEALDLAAGVASGLGAAHARAVIHRDVKPENVLLDVSSDGRVMAKLVDFGISRIAGSGGTSTAFAGTLAYVAPELFEDVAPSVASDLYALGIMIYEMMAGAPPFRGDSMASLMRMHALEPPTRPAGIDDDVWAVIEGLLDKNPAARPRSAVAVADQLRALAGGRAALTSDRDVTGTALRPLTAPPVPPASPASTEVRPRAASPPQPVQSPAPAVTPLPTRTRRPGRWIGLGIGAGLLVTVVIIAVVFALNRDPQEVAAPPIPTAQQPMSSEDDRSKSDPYWWAEVGACYDRPADGSMPFTTVFCKGQHHHQVYALFGVDHVDYPGDVAMKSESETRCEDAIEGFVGSESRRLEWHYVAWPPNVYTWNAGHREVMCAFAPPPGEEWLYGDARDRRL